MLLVCDQADTLLKGEAHYLSLGPSYPVKQALTFVLVIVAASVRGERWQRAVVAAVIAMQVAWLAWHDVLAG